MKIRTRFAPSPTGSPHIGHLRTCAYAYALAKHNNGEFLLRIEDTDRRRYVSGAVEIIKKMVADFGMKWDEYYVQTERAAKGMYKKAAEHLVKEGKAFYCQCEAKDAKHSGYSNVLRDPCRDKNLKEGAIKIRVPDEGEIGYHDFVFDKDITWDLSTVFDATLLKSKDLNEMPTYHLAATYDDHDMEITHVLRGYDWMPSTPIHLLLYKYLGFERPEIGHLTDIQSQEGGKLSKRKGSTSIEQFESEGYLKEAIFNFTILLGWAPKDNRELFTLEEFVEAFDSKGFQKSNPVFNRKKLDWFNGEYIRNKTDSQLFNLLIGKTSYGGAKFIPDGMNEDLINKTIPLVKQRMSRLDEFRELVEFFVDEPKIDANLFVEKSGGDKNLIIEQLKSSVELANNISNWTLENIQNTFQKMTADKSWKNSQYFMMLRIAITGKTITPPLMESMVLLGKDACMARLQGALQILS